MDPRLEKKYSDFVTQFNIIRCSLLLIIVPLCVYLFFEIFMFAFLLLVALWYLGEWFIQKFYKANIIKPVLEDFTEIKIKRLRRNLDLELLCIFPKSKFDYTNSYSLYIENKEYIISNFNASHRIGKYNHVDFAGHIYECVFPYSYEGAVFVCKSHWKHNHVGELAYNHGEYEVRTTSGIIDDNIKGLLENKLFPMLERMQLRNHIMVIIDNKLYVLEDQDSWNFQIGYFTNLKKQIERDSKIFETVKMNFNVMNEMV